MQNIASHLCREGYKNLREDEKQSLIEHRKNYSKWWENKTTSQIKID